tara:strand:+ start:334 stop:543 length:210 start_codon:yes stop_codon:yes gene_type:complete
MLKIGFKAAHFSTINRVGTIVDIETIKNNQMTIGGTTEARVYITLEYLKPNGESERVKYPSGDLMRVFE